MKNPSLSDLLLRLNENGDVKPGFQSVWNADPTLSIGVFAAWLAGKKVQEAMSKAKAAKEAGGNGQFAHRDSDDVLLEQLNAKRMGVSTDDRPDWVRSTDREPSVHDMIEYRRTLVG